MSKIEWTEDTWNPIVGCSIVSPGCTNCYAMKMAGRLEKMNRTSDRSGYVNPYDGTTTRVNGNTVWAGKVALAKNALFKPLKRKSPTTYFVNSMGDLFHEDVPDEWVDQVIAIMALCPQHTFQILTKRADRMRDYMRSSFDRIVMQMFELVRDHCVPTVKESCKRRGMPWERPTARDSWWPLSNVWLGISAEDQSRADERIPALLETPAAIRFVSAEPLLGSLDIHQWLHESDCHGINIEGSELPWHGECNCKQAGRIDIGYEPTINWVIAGGESGHKARPMHPDWVRSVRDQCAEANVPFFFKQWGEWLPGEFDIDNEIRWPALCDVPTDRNELPDMDGDPKWIDGLSMLADGHSHCIFNKVGKKTAGRKLDGLELEEIPDTSVTSC